MTYYINKKQQCLKCDYSDFTIINGNPKCYRNCPYRQKGEKIGVEKWV